MDNMKFGIRFVATYAVLCLFIVAMPIAASQNMTVNSTNNTTTLAITEIRDVEFLVCPTIELRPYRGGSFEGAELFISNSPFNNVAAQVDACLHVPKGVHIYSDEFMQISSNDNGTTYTGRFEVPSGTVRTLHINIKAAANVGDFNVHFSGLYWPDDRKENVRQMAITLPITTFPPPTPTLAPPPISITQILKWGIFILWCIFIGLVVLIIFIAPLWLLLGIFRRRKGGEGDEIVITEQD